MLFVKKTKSAVADKQAEPRMQSPADIIDVEVVREIVSDSAEPVLNNPAPEDFQPTGHGLFMDEKPVVSNVEPKGLRARFARAKPTVDAGVSSDKVPAKKWAPFKKAAAPQATAEPVVAQAPTPAADEQPRKSKWSLRKPTGPAAAAGTPPEAAAAPAQVRPTANVKKPIIVQKASDRKKKFQEIPIRVFIGFLPEVSERDARDFALGIAERNCEQISLVYYDAFKMNNGYAYEVHEGGAGRAFLPEIISYFSTLGPFEKGGGESSVYIRTATRTVQVDRTLEGLQSFLLPESSTEAPSDWLEGTSKMTAAIQVLTGVLVFGAALFTTGFLAMSLALVSRIQPYDPPPAPTVDKATDNYQMSPMSRWTVLQGVSGSEYVKALRFKNNKWELDRGTAEPVPAEQPPVAAPAAAN
jgi:hypothetical protein